MQILLINEVFHTSLALFGTSIIRIYVDGYIGISAWVRSAVYCISCYNYIHISYLSLVDWLCLYRKINVFTACIQDLSKGIIMNWLTNLPPWVNLHSTLKWIYKATPSDTLVSGPPPASDFILGFLPHYWISISLFLLRMRRMVHAVQNIVW